MTTLPANATLLDGPGVWMEGAALRQLAQVASLPRCTAAVGMPDLHPGPTVPIGAAFAFDGEVRPGLVGSDAGCGVRVVVLPTIKARGEKLMRRARQELEGDALPDVDPAALLRAVWRSGARGLLQVPGVPSSLAALAEAEPEPPAAPVGPMPEASVRLGSIGGGNHFLEVSEVGKVRPGAAALGLKRGGFAVVAHSGSRGLGHALARQWSSSVLTGAQQEAYLAQLAGAVRCAQVNRLVLAWRMLSILGMARVSRISGGFDVTHNAVTPAQLDGQRRWLHRKGAAPAGRDQPTIVLGSRGTVSWVMRGCGAAGCLCSVAHGAGRKMARGEAVDKLRQRYTRASLARTRLGGAVLCPDSKLLYAEHPDAYKAIEPVVDALEAAGAAQRLAPLSPLLTVKM